MYNVYVTPKAGSFNTSPAMAFCNEQDAERMVNWFKRELVDSLYAVSLYTPDGVASRWINRKNKWELQ